MEHHFFESIQRGRDDKGVHWVSAGTDWYKSHQSRCRHHLCQQRKPAIRTQNGIRHVLTAKAPNQRMKMQVQDGKFPELTFFQQTYRSHVFA